MKPGGSSDTTGKVLPAGRWFVGRADGLAGRGVKDVGTKPNGSCAPGRRGIGVGPEAGPAMGVASLVDGLLRDPPDF